MTFNYIKKTFCAIVILSCTFFLSMTFFSSKASGEINFLTACVGETYDTVGINYHCTEDNSYLIYGTSLSGKEISNPKQVQVTSTPWSYTSNFMNDAEIGYTFNERYVCKAQLTNLDANTTYYYQAISGTTKSGIQSFTTTSTTGSKKSFLFLTDIQSSGGSFKNAENLIQAIETESNTTPNLVVMTGDQVDRGGIEQQWIDYYTYVPSLHNKLHATVPGNHEYYLTSESGYHNNSIYNQFTNNPMNGPADRLGSSYYFVWDQILFIMLDTVKRDYDVTAQQEWFKNVVKNNPSQWIIVGSHPGVYATGAYVDDASTMRRNWLKIFEECQVDLALNGHEHVYCRKTNRYGGSSTSTNAGAVDEELGVTYLQGAAAGLKSYSDKIKPSLLDDFDTVERNNNMGVLVSVETGRLIIKCYMASGLVIDQFELYAKRPTKIVDISKEEIMNSISAEFDASTNSVNIAWTPDAYGNAKSVEIESYVDDENKTKIMNESITISSSSEKINSKTYLGYYDSSNYIFNVKVNFSDDTSLERSISLITNIDLLDINIEYELNGGTNNANNLSKIKVGDLPFALNDATKVGYRFKGWYDKETNRRIRELKDKTQLNVKLVAVFEIETYSISYNFDGGTRPSDYAMSYTVESIPTLPSTTKVGYKFKGWLLNEELITELPQEITGDLTLKALFEKEVYSINYNLDGGTNPSDVAINYTFDLLPTLPTPTKVGYKFAGWTLNGNKVLSLEYGTTGDITLQATWEKKVYKITYNLDGGTNPSDAKTTYSYDEPVTLPVPTKDGYNFDGWTLNGVKITEIPENSVENLTLNATWSEVIAPKNPAKKGCKKASMATIFASITLFASAVLIFRKKH